MSDPQTEACREAVMNAYSWIAIMKSTDRAKNAKIGRLRIAMELVRDQFEELFP